MDSPVYAWAARSLGAAATATLNDFLSPIVLLVVALTTAIQSNYPFTPSIGYPYFLGLNNGSSAGPIGTHSSLTPPWGNRTVAGTSPLDVPNTGVTRYYDFTVSRGLIAPDGVNRSSLLVNNQFPGPMIEANWGDYIQVTVHNKIDGPSEGTSLHWHGIPQKDTPWYDGTVAISQCPIAPGSSFTYKFQASLYGTSWWHSHLSAQYTDGLYGPMVVYGPSDEDYDFDLGPVLIHDYYHPDYTKLIENVVGNDTLTAIFAPSDNTLIHGPTYQCALGSTGCASNPGLQKFSFTAGKKHRLRLINPSSSGSPILFSIDNHTMTIIANDFTPVVPYDTNVVRIGAGQRTDVVVTATGKSGDAYWMRIRQPDLCNLVLQPFGLAALYYDGADTLGIPLDSFAQPDFNIPLLTACNNDPLEVTSPAYEITPVAKPDATLLVNMTLVVNSTGHTLYEMNNQAFQGDFNEPLLGLYSSNAIGNGNVSTSPRKNLYDFGNAQNIRLVVNNNIPFSHPMHLHGQQMFVLASGEGTWNGSITNPTNPQRRDTHLVPANGYMVVQLTADNPGVWPFHCHIAWHLSAGMLINLALKPDEIRDAKEIPEVLAETCEGEF